MTTKRVIVATTVAYAVYVIGLSALLGSLHHHHPSAWLAGLLCLPAAVLGGYAVVHRFHEVRAGEGLESHVQTESAALAFLATVLAALTYALLEDFAHAPRLSMWAVWTFGLASWLAAKVILRYRYR